MAAATSPRVAIVTPSLDQGRWLADNVRSVTAQSFTAIEHLVMDGGSTDGSLDILHLASKAVAPSGSIGCFMTRKPIMRPG